MGDRRDLSAWLVAGLAVAVCGVALLDTRGGRGSPGGTAPAVASSELGLGERMNALARRFAGLWFAATSGNAGLAAYELEEMNEAIEGIQALKLVEKGVQVADVLQAMVNTELGMMARAIEARDGPAFEKAYRRTIDTCNDCHRQTEHPFIRIAIPRERPVTNRVYEPEAAPAASR